MHWWRRKNKIHRKCTCIKCGLIFIQDQGYLTNDWQSHTLYYISVNQLCLPVIMMRNEHFPPKKVNKINEAYKWGQIQGTCGCLIYTLKYHFTMFINGLNEGVVWNVCDWHSRTNALTKYGWFIGIMESGHGWL